MPITPKCKNCNHKTHWFEKGTDGEWFVCFFYRVHGEKQIVRVSVEKINEKVKEAE